MAFVKNFKLLSVYNQRLNKQLLDCCSSMTKELLEKESHSFFPNIMSYWNHILFGDQILLRRLADNNIAGLTFEDLAGLPKAQAPNDMYCATISEVSTLRKKVDNIIIRYCESLTDTMCDQVIRYQTTEGDNIEQYVGVITQHMFNHQAHHRGQLTCVLSQFGVDYGCTDLPIIIADIK